MQAARRPSLAHHAPSRAELVHIPVVRPALVHQRPHVGGLQGARARPGTLGRARCEGAAAVQAVVPQPLRAPPVLGQVGAAAAHVLCPRAAAAKPLPRAGYVLDHVSVLPLELFASALMLPLPPADSTLLVGMNCKGSAVRRSTLGAVPRRRREAVLAAEHVVSSRRPIRLPAPCRSRSLAACLTEQCTDFSSQTAELGGGPMWGLPFGVLVRAVVLGLSSGSPQVRRLLVVACETLSAPCLLHLARTDTFVCCCCLNVLAPSPTEGERMWGPKAKRKCREVATCNCGACHADTQPHAPRCLHKGLLDYERAQVLAFGVRALDLLEIVTCCGHQWLGHPPHTATVLRITDEAARSAAAQRGCGPASQHGIQVCDSLHSSLEGVHTPPPPLPAHVPAPALPT